jgi:hypothetical protein
MTRRERKFKRQEFYADPANSWVNVFKGCLLALIVSKGLFLLGEVTYEFTTDYWADIQASR